MCSSITYLETAQTWNRGSNRNSDDIQQIQQKYESYKQRKKRKREADKLRVQEILSHNGDNEPEIVLKKDYLDLPDKIELIETYESSGSKMVTINVLREFILNQHDIDFCMSIVDDNELCNHNYLFIHGLNHGGTSIFLTRICEFISCSNFGDLKDIENNPENEGAHLTFLFPSGHKEVLDNCAFPDMNWTPPVRNKRNILRLFGAWSKYWDMSENILIEKDPNLYQAPIKTEFFPGVSSNIFIMRHLYTIACGTHIQNEHGIPIILNHQNYCDHPVACLQLFVQMWQFVLSTYHFPYLILCYEGWVNQFAEPDEIGNERRTLRHHGGHIGTEYLYTNQTILQSASCQDNARCVELNTQLNKLQFADNFCGYSLLMTEKEYNIPEQSILISYLNENKIKKLLNLLDEVQNLVANYSIYSN